MVVTQDAAFDTEIAYCVEGKRCQSCEGDRGNVSVGCEIEAVDKEGDEKDERNDSGGHDGAGSGDCSPNLRYAFGSRTLYLTTSFWMATHRFFSSPTKGFLSPSNDHSRIDLPLWSFNSVGLLAE